MPNASDTLTIDPRLLERLKGIELKSRYLVRGFHENRHRTRDFGASNEFIEHKDYQQGDEIRRIDWRVFVAMMAVAQQDSVGLFCLGDRLEEHIPARQGMRHLAMLYQHLGAPRGKGGGNFGEVAWDAMTRIGRRGVTFVLTDALDELDPIFETLKGLVVREQDVTLLQVLDETELTFPFDTMTEFRHPESGRRIMGDPLQLRARYLERLEAHQERIRTFCSQQGVDYLRVHNGDDLITLLSLHFLQRLVRRSMRC